MNKPDNILVKHYAGSIAYGTNLPTSDTDFRGIYSEVLTGPETPWSKPRSEQWEDPSEEDTVLTELRKYMVGYVNGSSNVLESLWVEESDIIQTSDAYEYLRSRRGDLLSKKLRWSFGGYALGQLKRIKGHNKWINNPQSEVAPKREDYFKLIQNFTEEKIFAKDFDIKKYAAGYHLIPYGNYIYGVVEDSVLPVFKGLFNRDGSLREIKYKDIPEEIRKKNPDFVVKLNEEEFKRDLEVHSNYWTWKRERNEARAKLEQDHGYDCYSEDTEFLTNNGWKLFDDIKEEDLIATFNKDHCVEFHKPIARIDNKYTGDMYHFTGHHQDTLVTANHQMYVRHYSKNKKEPRGGWIGEAACKLPECYEVLNVIKPKVTTLRIPVSRVPDMDIMIYLKLMGWYVTDGTTTFKNGSPDSIRIYCYDEGTDIFRGLSHMLKKGLYGISKYVNARKGGPDEIVFSFPRSLAEALYADCGHRSREKRLPKWVFGMSGRMSRILMKSLLNGDAYRRPKLDSTYSYYTVNSRLADDVQTLAVLCGYEASKWGPYASNSGYKYVETYHVHVNTNPVETRVNCGGNLSISPVKDYRVVCFELPNNTVITRRNGRISLHKQCKHAMHIVRLLRMGEEVLTDGIIRVKRPDAAELLAIREGKWTIDELLEWADDQDAKLTHLMKSSSLPDKVDLSKASEILLRTEEIANG